MKNRESYTPQQVAEMIRKDRAYWALLANVRVERLRKQITPEEHCDNYELQNQRESDLEDTIPGNVLSLIE